MLAHSTAAQVRRATLLALASKALADLPATALPDALRQLADLPSARQRPRPPRVCLN